MLNGRKLIKLGEKTKSVSICSYNLLAESLLNPQIHNLTAETKDLTYRFKMFCHEFSLLSADIFCFQELDFKSLQSTFLSHFESIGYNSLYVKRTSDDKHDGCAIFYKNVNLLKHEIVKYKEMDEDANDNVGIVSIFEKENFTFCVSTTHILWNPKRGDTKLKQIDLLFSRLPHNIPIILCGDFNLSPGSQLYKYISGRSFDINLTSSRVYAQRYVPEMMRKGEAKIKTHEFNFVDALKSLDLDECFSTSHKGDVSIVDYFWIGSHESLKASIKVVEYLELPIKQFDLILPDASHPSDHIPLYAVFNLE